MATLLITVQGTMGTITPVTTMLDTATKDDHGPGKSEEVSYVLPNWKTIHSRDAAETSELVALMTGLGCEVRTDDHGHHKESAFVVRSGNILKSHLIKPPQSGRTVCERTSLKHGTNTEL